MIALGWDSLSIWRWNLDLEETQLLKMQAMIEGSKAMLERNSPLAARWIDEVQRLLQKEQAQALAGKAVPVSKATRSSDEQWVAALLCQHSEVIQKKNQLEIDLLLLHHQHQEFMRRSGELMRKRAEKQDDLQHSLGQLIEPYRLFEINRVHCTEAIQEFRRVYLPETSPPAPN